MAVIRKLNAQKLIVVILTLIELNSCNKEMNRHYGLPNNFHKMWQNDTCGMKGIRLKLFYDLTEKKANLLFIGKNQKEIINIFGIPDKEDSNEWLNYYWYNLSAVDRNGKECGEATVESLYITFDKINKKVVEFYRVIH